MNARRRIPRHPASEEIGLQIAPMIDITLLLLFFFMLSNGTEPAARRREIRLPEADTEQPSDTETASRKLVLEVDASGGWFAGETRVNSTQLRALLETKSILLIRADARTPAATIQRIAQTAAQAGIVTLEHTITPP
jgi:biopolymer transport protein ExbD